MAIERHSGNEPAGSRPGRIDGRERPPPPADRPIPDERPAPERQQVPGGGPAADKQPVPAERRTRDELYAALRAADTRAEYRPPPGNRDAPRTTPDGGWEWKSLRLDADANRVADRDLSAKRHAEGRHADGSYGDRGITPAMRRVEASLEHGTLAPDTEKFSLKSPDRFKEKLAKLMVAEPGKSPAELSTEIHDGVRYTFIFNVEHYSVGVDAARHQLSKVGFELIGFKPSWGGDEYKGINSKWRSGKWRDLASGQLFEVQFHSGESWSAKQETHEAYEKIASPETSPAERSRLRDYQRKVSAEIPTPPGALEFLPYRAKEG